MTLQLTPESIIIVTGKPPIFTGIFPSLETLESAKMPKAYSQSSTWVTSVSTCLTWWVAPPFFSTSGLRGPPAPRSLVCFSWVYTQPQNVLIHYNSCSVSLSLDNDDRISTTKNILLFLHSHPLRISSFRWHYSLHYGPHHFLLQMNGSVFQISP